MLHGPA